MGIQEKSANRRKGKKTLGIHEEISNVIEKDAELSKKRKQLSDVHCDCYGNDLGVTSWQFPILCRILSNFICI
jgi:hypothetical protein